MATEIGGDRVTIDNIVPIGGDPHLYDPRPSDAKKVIDADVILVNGLTFEGWIKKLIENSGTKATVITITDGLTPIASEDYANAFDPHAWMSAANGGQYIKNIYDALVKLAPQDKAYFEENYNRYSNELKTTHEYILKSINSIPEGQRVLITSHDAFAYYGQAYGLELQAIKGISTEEETQAGDIMRVSQAIKKSGVPAIFIESTINPKMIQQIASDNDVKVGGELFADSLGPKNGEAGTYIKMLRHNTDVIVGALSKLKNTATKIDSEQSSNSWLMYLLLGVVMLIVMGLLISKFK